MTNHGAAGEPVSIYLDQFVWVQMARGRADGDASIVNLVDQLTEQRRRGRIVVPLSATHYLETWHRSRTASLQDVAAVMRDVSGYTTVIPFHLAEWQAVEAVVARLSFTRSPLPKAVFARGVNHAFASNTGRFRFRESIAGPGRDEGPRIELEELFTRPGTLAAFRRASSTGHDAWEWLNLGGELDMFDRFPGGIDRTPEHRHGEDAKQAEEQFRAALRADPAMYARLADIVVAQQFMRIQPALFVAGARRRFDMRTWLDGRSVAGGIDHLVGSGPTADVLAALQQFRHRDFNLAIEQHDATDLHMLACVVPLCDVVVTERRWAHAVKQTGLATKYTTTMLTSTRALSAWLAQQVREQAAPPT